MTIRTEFINFIVSRTAIEAKHPGGWDKFLKENGFHAGMQRIRFSLDDYLYRCGAMNPLDIQSMAEHWGKKGFVGLSQVNGKQVWTDYCIYEGFWPLEYDCPWLVKVDWDHVRHVDDKEQGNDVG
jgi:hypothetical protein